MFSLIRNFGWLQTLVVKMLNGLHPAIEHNIGKIGAIKRSMYLANLEGVPGDYLEFGMFEGTSFISAFEAHRTTTLPDGPQRAFFGWDSFEGFKYFSEKDKHPFFKESAFKSSYEKVTGRISRHFANRARWTVTPGYVEQTIGEKTPADFGIDAVAVALIDMDLGGPAMVALNFMKPALQRGSVIVLDDFFAYRGASDRGTAGAFFDFQAKNPHIIFRRLLDYGYGGQAYMVAATPAAKTTLLA